MKISPKYFPALLLFLACFIRLVYFYQLGILEWNFFKNDYSAFYYLEKAWDHGLQNQQLATLLNDLTDKLGTRSIS